MGRLADSEVDYSDASPGVVGSVNSSIDRLVSVQVGQTGAMLVAWTTRYMVTEESHFDASVSLDRRYRPSLPLLLRFPGWPSIATRSVIPSAASWEATSTRSQRTTS